MADPPISEVAARFQVAWPTVKRWADRYRVGETMEDRSSRPKTSPNKTPKAVTKRCVSLRMRLREGPVQLSARLGIAPSTVHRILTSARLNRLSHVDRATGEPIRRYEHDHPGALVHVDVKKIGNIPNGGGWRFVGRRQGEKNRAATPDKPRNQWHNPKMGYAFIHSVIDDHSRVVYSEVHDDETALTAAMVLLRAHAWFTERGVIVERVLSDNGSAYKSRLWHQTCDQLGINVKKTRPYRPQTNGKIEGLLVRVQSGEQQKGPTHRVGPFAVLGRPRIEWRLCSRRSSPRHGTRGHPAVRTRVVRGAEPAGR